mgnify:CR=1 FL=1
MKKTQKKTEYQKLLEERGYKTNFTEKPDVRNVWFVSLVSFKKGCKEESTHVGGKQEAYNPKIHDIEHVLVPLYDLEVFSHYNKIFLSFLEMSKEDVNLFKDKKYHKILVSATTDPNIEWAGDWSDLGDHRLVYILQNAKVNTKMRSVEFSTDLCYQKGSKLYKNFDKQVHVADREVWFRDV